MTKKTQPKKKRRTLLMTPKEMSRVSGIGENTLRDLMATGKLEFLQIGSHRLICEDAIWKYYEQNKTSVCEACSAKPQSVGA